MKEYQFHRLAKLFPLMEGEEFEELVADIQANGAQIPVVLYEGKILDGRNRYLAAKQAGVAVLPTTEYKGDDAAGYVMSANLIRRHLSKSQRALIALEILPFYSERAKARVEAQDFGRGVTQGKNTLGYGVGQARDEAGRAAGVSGSYVEKASKVKRDAPELLPAIESGALDVPTAAILATLGNKKIRARATATVLKEDLSEPKAQRVIEAVRQADDFGGEAQVKRVLALSIDRVMDMADSLPKRPTSKPKHKVTAISPIHFSWLKDPQTSIAENAIGAVDTVVMMIAKGDRDVAGGKAVLKRLRQLMTRSLSKIDTALDRLA